MQFKLFINFIAVSLASLFVVTSCANPNFLTSSGETALKPVAKDYQYKELIKDASKKKEIVYFFSFNCPDCYKSEIEQHLTDKIKESIPKDVALQKYHHETFKNLAKELSEAWAIANILNVEDKIIPLIYEQNIKEKTLKTEQDIKNIFSSVGVDSKKYEAMKKDPKVLKFVKNQHQSQIELNPIYIPTIYVNGKYFINPDNLDNSSDDNLVKDYIRVINHILAL